MLLVIGSHSRNVGKTSIICGLIRSLEFADWTAVKISANRQSPGNRDGFYIEKESVVGSCCDTARYLQAGARRSFWIKASEAQLPSVAPLVQEIVDTSTNVIIESNRILDYIDPDLYLLALDSAVDDFKDSALRFFDRADAYMVVERSNRVAAWSAKVDLSLLSERMSFPVRRGSFESSDLASFVGTRIEDSSGQHRHDQEITAMYAPATVARDCPRECDTALVPARQSVAAHVLRG